MFITIILGIILVSAFIAMVACFFELLDLIFRKNKK